jgi:hypothetical protein
MLSPSQEGSRSIAGSEDEGSGEEKINTLISVPQRGMRAATMGRSTTCKNDDDSSGGEEETADHAGVDEQGEAEQLKNGKETEPQSKDFIGKDEDISPTGFKRDVDDDVSSDEEESSHENGYGKLIRFQLFCNSQLIKVRYFLFCFSLKTTLLRTARGLTDYSKTITRMLTRGRVESVLVMSKTNLRTSLESMSKEKLKILRVRVRETRNNRYQT